MIMAMVVVVLMMMKSTKEDNNLDLKEVCLFSVFFFLIVSHRLYMVNLRPHRKRMTYGVIVFIKKQQQQSRAYEAENKFSDT